MDRRQLVARGALAAGWALASARRVRGFARGGEGGGPDEGGARSFSTDDAGLTRIYEAALATVRGNVVRLADFPGPVLAEGSYYPGAWMECAPHEALVWSAWGTETARAVARNQHLMFFALQKEDGQLPYAVKVRSGAGSEGGPGFGQIQMVVPVAATAWELSQQTGDHELLEKAYAACGRWDAWLRKYRNTRGTGLCEGFCTWDTGMDNSPRWKEEPNACPDDDARRCPPGPGLPRLCPDLSATVYGGRVALAAMAQALGRSSEADRWTQDAEEIRRLIVAQLYYEHDGGFYDLDAQGRFVWVRSAATLRVLGEHVPDEKLFETVWKRQVRNEKVFWTPYPFPSVALDDPEFVRPIPRNSWGGAAQALTALRAPRWMEHYGKPAELAWVMERWVEAVQRANAFRQQMDPLSGEFTADAGGYSPTALALLDFVWRLSGVREQGDLVEWNVRPPARGRTKFSAQVHGVTAELEYNGGADSGLAELRIGGKSVASVIGVVRVLTTRTGELREAVGIADGLSPVTLREGGAERRIQVEANARVKLG
ncbi:MAG TPA: hypothetical protein VK819_05795 [Acidobacteriaceae bacterium]|nr:hypothetical protein [Acidobacteriaceae bacterium]